MRVIGITGTNGSGKGTVVEVLQKFSDCIHVSARELIVQLAKEEGVNITDRDATRIFNEKRNKEGRSLIQDFITMYDIPLNKDKVFIFESIRRTLEIEILRNYFGYKFLMVAVDAPIEIRYQRISKRNSITDNVDFENFKKQEELESVGEKGFEMNIPKCIAMSDVLLSNGGSYKDFEREIKEKIMENHRELFVI